MTLVAPWTLAHTPPQPMQIGKGVYKGGKEKKKGGIDTPKQAMATQTTPSRSIPTCAICDVSSHTTFNCPRLRELKELYNIDDLGHDPSIPRNFPFLSHQLNMLSLYKKNTHVLCAIPMAIILITVLEYPSIEMILRSFASCILLLRPIRLL
jgi:hypothetical protein